MRHRLASFFRLPATERRLAARAVVTLAAVRLLLFLRPFPQARERVDRWSGGGASGTADRTAAEAVCRALERAVRTLPGSACLAQALTAEILLRRDGHPVQVSIGVAPGASTSAGSGGVSVSDTLNAHAWARSAGVLVAGARADLASYRTLAVFGADPQGRSG